jgi:hypothetical protein
MQAAALYAAQEKQRPMQHRLMHHAMAAAVASNATTAPDITRAEGMWWPPAVMLQSPVATTAPPTNPNWLLTPAPANCYSH